MSVNLENTSPKLPTSTYEYSAWWIRPKFLYLGTSSFFHFWQSKPGVVVRRREEMLPSSQHRRQDSSKGLSHEKDFKKIDKNLQN
jgi:hypothetical protein